MKLYLAILLFFSISVLELKSQTEYNLIKNILKSKYSYLGSILNIYIIYIIYV